MKPTIFMSWKDGMFHLFFNLKTKNVQNEMPAEMSSVHIMADGTVISPQGAHMPGTTILSNGNIKLGDGRIVKPAADFR